MATRREFIQAGVAAIGAPLAAGSRPSSPPALYKAVFDHRFPASVQFGSDMAARGVPAYGIHGDITSLWFHDLYHCWKQEPAPIAGLTAHAALFCLERLAWDQGLRVLSRAESGLLVAWTIGPKVA